MTKLSLFLCLALASACNDSSSNGDGGARDLSGVAALPIGSPCAKDTPTSSVCGPFPTYFCDSDHPNGYCKTSCHKDADCPTGSLCAGAGATAPGECHKKCTQATAATDCRLKEGYVCKDKPTDASGDYCDVPEPDGGV
jgi:hypothetical protein